MGRLHTFVVTLRRDTRDSNWGLRLVGGSDLATPLIVTRVTPGTQAGRELARGDIIAKIDEYDARDLRHEDAQNLFKNAQNQIKLVVQRDVDREGPRNTPLAPRSPTVSYAAHPPFRTPSPKPGNAWRGPESLPRSTPMLQTQFPVLQEGEYATFMPSPASSRNEDVIDESIGSQPYRTTPLVLPGAKVRREPGPTESYLRHHPNPAMRAPPHHDYRDTIMKQKVAESVLQRVVGDEANKVVHKQFNSPINLYSEQNIANSIRQQTSPLPADKPVPAYDPSSSETYRALQEEGLGNAKEVSAPQPKVFSQPASKPVPTKPTTQNNTTATGKQTTFVNAIQEEHIQQSNSFKRLMYNVLGETAF
ncbi:LIM domain-binding protein 3 isoform X4 [Leptidea sinapis]|uniref:LIM domain-binding protein 3 isoform X4 n=1 Tax=Leptidea sinapis TaxID=189913 RepID=UPI00212EBC16|nr:LIM domain-binding protein 3 isoform X4 [Leptidea sinapis]